MDEVLCNLPPEGALADRIRESIDSNVLFFSFVGLTKEERHDFQNALEQALAIALTRGPVEFSLPDYYPTFIELFEELVRLSKSVT